MQTYEILVRNRAVIPNSQDMTLVRTSIGIDQVHVMFDNAEWLDFPIKITFGQGNDLITTPLTVGLIDGSDEWVAEATVTIPYEVIDMTGPIRVTLQGTDSEGRHIITAQGSPLSVEEAGDVDEGSMPDDAPTQDEWQQAYADARILMNEMRTTIDNLQAQIDGIVQDAKDEIDDEVERGLSPATTASLGVVQIGTGLTVTDSGILSADETNGMTTSQVLQLANLARLAAYGFDTEFDDYGILRNTVKVKTGAIPIDDETIKVNDDGKLYVSLTSADGEGY